jgi:hypothetical protein
MVFCWLAVVVLLCLDPKRPDERPPFCGVSFHHRAKGLWRLLLRWDYNMKNRTLTPVAQLFIDCAREVAKPLSAGKSVSAPPPLKGQRIAAGGA